MKNILLIILTMLCACTFAQPRVNGTDIHTKLIKSSPVVSNFVGWAYDSYKQRWSGYYNAIINEYNNNSKTPKRLSASTLAKKTIFEGISNIADIQTKKYFFENKTYYLFLVKEWLCYYDYPELQIGYHFRNFTYVYATTDDEYNKIHTISDSINRIAIYKLGCYPYLEAFFPSYKNIDFMLMDYFHSGEDKIGDMIKEYQNQQKEKLRYGLYFSDCSFLYYKKEDSNSSIRFSRFNSEDCNFEYEYYEIPITEWNKLIIK